LGDCMKLSTKYRAVHFEAIHKLFHLRVTRADA
jgi:hypothetical protein